MAEFSHPQKVALIKRILEEVETEADATPLARTAKLIGIGRVKTSEMYNHAEARLKDPKKIASLDLALAKLAAQPGSFTYRRRWNDLKRKLDNCRTESSVEDFDHYIVDVAYGVWAPIALDANQQPAERLLYGRMAERILFDWVYKLGGARNLLKGSATKVRDEEASARGLEVIDAVVDFLGQHSVAPNCFFVQEPSSVGSTSSPAAKRIGYRIFRTEMFADQIGWHGKGLANHAARAQLYAEAYKHGLADDLMWLHSAVGKFEIAYANNAWNLAIHDADWTKSVHYAAELFQTFEDFLSKSVMRLMPVCEDETVWPGIAAIIAEPQIGGLERVRERLESGDERFAKMMAAVHRMLPGISQNRSYIEVLKMGTSQ